MKTALLVSPSAPCAATPQHIAILESGMKTLISMGISVKEAPHARAMHPVYGYFAASVEDRVADLVAGYQDASVDFLIAGTGGWNVSHLLSQMPWDVIHKNPKPLAGFSDISVLQAAAYAKTHVRQLHSPMVRWGMAEATEFTQKSFVAALNGERQILPIASFGSFMQGGSMHGTVIAGNLVSLATLLGTEYEPDWKGKILCWEETEETLFRIDRALTHFRNAGVWKKLAGMVIGQMDQTDETFNGKTVPVMDMLREHFRDINLPILTTSLFGHPKGVDFLTLPTGGTLTATQDKVEIL